MEREQTTIRLPAELKEQLQQEADKMCMGVQHKSGFIDPFNWVHLILSLCSLIFAVTVLLTR